MPITQYYPKPRELLTKIIPFARTDSAQERCWLPRDAIVVGVFVIQTSNCDGTTGTVSCGYSGGTDLINAFNTSTNDLGMFVPGGKAGTSFLAGTKLDTDKLVTTTYAVGDSTTGGVGFIRIDYFMPGSGETITS